MAGVAGSGGGAGGDGGVAVSRGDSAAADVTSGRARGRVVDGGYFFGVSFSVFRFSASHVAGGAVGLSFRLQRQHVGEHGGALGEQRSGGGVCVCGDSVRRGGCDGCDEGDGRLDGDG